MFDGDSNEERGWRDRSGVLRALGAVLLLAGWGALLAGPVVTLTGRGGLADAAVVFLQGLPLAATLLACGVGLFQLRRWARQAVIAVSFVFLAKGVLLTFQFVKQLPMMIEQVAGAEKPPPPEIIEGLQGASIALAGFLYLFLPALYLWVVSGRNAAATLAAREPEPSRLDRIPGPVLALAFLLVWEGAGYLTMLWFNAAVPVFGRVLSGLAGGLVLAGAALLCFRCAAGLAQGSRRAWQLAAGLAAAACLSWAATHYSAAGPALYKELYERMGFKPDEVRLFLATEAGPWNARWTLAGTVATLAYTLWLGRFFRRDEGAQDEAEES